MSSNSFISGCAAPATMADFFESLHMPMHSDGDADNRPTFIVPGVYGVHVWPVWGPLKQIWRHDAVLISNDRIPDLFQRHVLPSIGALPVSELPKQLPVLSKSLRVLVDTEKLGLAEAIQTWNCVLEMLASYLASSKEPQPRTQWRHLGPSTAEIDKAARNLESPVGWVYALRSQCGHVKIGWTGGSPLDRVESIETACPSELTVECVIRGTRSVERSLHQRFASLRGNGEWFRYDEKISEVFIERRADQLAEAVRFIERRDGKHLELAIAACFTADMALWSFDEWLDRMAGWADADLSAALLPRDKTERFVDVSRNSKCPCGSDRKFKRCCGAQGAVVA